MILSLFLVALVSNLFSLIYCAAAAPAGVKDTVFYDLLMVQPNATQFEIQVAFGSLSNQYHPQLYCPTLTKEAGRLLKLIQKVGAVLLNPNERQKYDQEGPSFPIDLDEFYQLPLDFGVIRKLMLDTRSNRNVNLPTQARRLPITANTKLATILNILSVSHSLDYFGWFIEALVALQEVGIVPNADFSNPYDLNSFQDFLIAFVRRYQPHIPQDNANYTVFDRIVNLVTDLKRVDLLKIFAEQLSYEAAFMFVSHDPLKVVTNLLQSAGSTINIMGLMHNSPAIMNINRPLIQQEAIEYVKEENLENDDSADHSTKKRKMEAQLTKEEIDSVVETESLSTASADNGDESKTVNVPQRKRKAETQITKDN